MTASRADRVSFGCSEEANFTYFGDALFAQALNQTDDLEQAFKRAKATVAEREQADHFEASEPQIWAPRTVLRSEEHTSALQSLMRTSYAVFCLKNSKSNAANTTE